MEQSTRRRAAPTAATVQGSLQCHGAADASGENEQQRGDIEVHGHSFDEKWLSEKAGCGTDQRVVLERERRPSESSVSVSPNMAAIRALISAVLIAPGRATLPVVEDVLEPVAMVIVQIPAFSVLVRFL